ncbi:MAG: SPFH domain-containing protein [Acetobacter sp.]|nr:SPFH domain-containing protein [Acetobacter sp.]
MGALPIAIPVVVVAILVIIIFSQGYLKAPPDQAFIISGMGKPRILTGKAGLKVPFFERVDKLDLGAIQIDVKTSSAVPTAEYINIKVDSYVNVRVGSSPEMLALAAQNFLNVSRDAIGEKVRDLLEGNIREIVGQMRLTEMVSDRKLFSEKVQENAVPDLARFGLELVSFNVQNFLDDNNVINDLGIDNVEQIRKSAAIAKSAAKREIAIAEAENARQANEAKAQAETDIAKKNAEVEIAKSELKAETDVKKAAADAAYSIQEQEQAKAINAAKVNAEIAQREREVELRQREIELKERELDATVRKQADADKYAAQMRAEADLIKRQKDAEAKAYEIEQAARAQKAKADADKYTAEQQAAGIAAVGAAEAEAIEKKAEAQKKMGEASVIEMVLKTMPEITAAAAAPLSKVDSITMYGDGNSAKMVGDVMKSTNQVMEALMSQGVDIGALLGGFFGAKGADNT